MSTPEFRGFALQLMSEYFDQSGADLFINTTVAPNAAPVLSTLSDRIPLGDFQTIAFWVTGYRGFAKKVLQKTYGRVAGLLAEPAALALRLKDALTAKSLPAVSSSSRSASNSPTEFDAARFDDFWNELVGKNFDKLLAQFATVAHSPGILPYHQRTGRLWIATVSRGGLLRAYGILKRQDGSDGIRRMQLVDYQTLDPDEDYLPGVLQLAAASLALAAKTCSPAEQGRLRGPQASQLRPLPASRYASQSRVDWRFYFRAADPAIHADLSRPEVWDPSTFDGDASFD